MALLHHETRDFTTIATMKAIEVQPQENDKYYNFETKLVYDYDPTSVAVADDFYIVSLNSYAGRLVAVRSDAKHRIVGDDATSSTETVEYNELVTYKVDTTNTLTEVKTSATNVVTIPHRIPVAEYKYVNNNGATPVAGVNFNVDTIGSAGLTWSYPNEFNITFDRDSRVRFTFTSTVQVRIGDYTSGATPGVRWDCYPVYDGVVSTLKGTIHNHVLVNSNNGVSAEVTISWDTEFNVTAGTHDFGYEYSIGAPGTIAGTVGNPYRHNLNQIHMWVQEIPLD